MFESTLFDNIVNHCGVKEYVAETVAALRKKGIKIGSTTCYTSAMMKKVMKLASENGYSPDFCKASDEVPAGRPKSFMIWANLTYFGIDNPRYALKVGDTVADIKEGLNANCCTAAVVMGSSELGLTEEEVKNTPRAELEAKKEKVRKVFYQAGEDYIINDMRELEGVIDRINQKLAQSSQHKLLTPGPLTTKYSVKHAMLTDHCTWDDENKEITANDDYATVLLQGSGSYAVEAMINCLSGGKVLFLVNGEYGKRMLSIAESAKLNYDFISIHVPTQGATEERKAEKQLSDISIHAPTQGATAKTHKPTHNNLTKPYNNHKNPLIL